MPSNVSALALGLSSQISLDDLSSTRFQHITRNLSDVEDLPELQRSATVDTISTTHTERSSTPSRRRPSFLRRRCPSALSTFGAAAVAIAAPASPELQNVELGKIEKEAEEPEFTMYGRHSDQWLFKGWKRAFSRMLS